MTKTARWAASLAGLLAALGAACATPERSADDDTRDVVCVALNGTLAEAGANADTVTVAEVTAELDASGVVAAGMDDRRLMAAIADLSVALEYGDYDGALAASRRVDALCNEE